MKVEARWVDELTLAEAAKRLNRWARGIGYGSEGTRDIVIEAAGCTKWLHDDATGLLRHGDMVVAPDAPAADATRRGERWVIGRGGLGASGGELAISDVLRVQAFDYRLIGFAALAGPTVFRLASTADAEAFIEDLDAATRGEGFRAELLDPRVELGDQCAIGDSRRCAAARLSRLYVDHDGAVKPSASGAPIGHVGDNAEMLYDAAADAINSADPCISGDVVTHLAARDAILRRAYLAALRAVRAMPASTRVDWRVAGFGWQLNSARPFRPRDDVVILEADGQHVVYDTGSSRACRVSARLGCMVEAILGASDATDVRDRLADLIPGAELERRRTTAMVLDRLARHGVHVPVAAA